MRMTIAGYQEMHWIDPDAVVFYTAYDGTSFREEVPLGTKSGNTPDNPNLKVSNSGEE